MNVKYKQPQCHKDSNDDETFIKKKKKQSNSVKDTQTLQSLGPETILIYFHTTFSLTPLSKYLQCSNRNIEFPFSSAQFVLSEEK